MWGVGNKNEILANCFKEEFENGISSLARKKVLFEFYKLDTYKLRVVTLVRSDWGNTIISEFTLSCLQGTCGILLSDHTHVHNSYQHVGIGSKLMEFKIKIATHGDLDFSQLMCVTIDPMHDHSQVYEEKILKKFDFKRINTFVNMRGGNTCHVWMKTVREIER